nr:uncharacterized protein LOC109184650 [Ipomoea trifida]
MSKAHTIRTASYSTEEDQLLCHVYVDICQDKITGHYQTGDIFWTRVVNAFHEALPANVGRTRSLRSIQSRIQTIMTAAANLRGCIVQVEKLNPSGASEQDIQGAHPGSKVSGYRSSDLNGESKVLTPGARCPVTGLRTLTGESKVLTPGARCPVTGRIVYAYLASADGSTPSSVSPSAGGPAFGATADSAVGPADAATSVDGPAEISTTGTGRDLRKVVVVHRDFQPSSNVVLHSPLAAVESPGPELIHQVLPDRSPRNGSENYLSGLLPSADMPGQQDRVGQDLLPEVRALQDPSPGLFGRPSHAIRSPTKAVDQPLVFSGGGAAAQILDSKAAGGSSPCFISTSITRVVDPDPSRRGLFTVATSSTSTISFSFPRLVPEPLRARRPNWQGGFRGLGLLGPEADLRRERRGASRNRKAPHSAWKRKERGQNPDLRSTDLWSLMPTNLVNQPPEEEARRLPILQPFGACTSPLGRI